MQPWLVWLFGLFTAEYSKGLTFHWIRIGGNEVVETWHFVRKEGYCNWPGPWHSPENHHSLPFLALLWDSYSNEMNLRSHSWVFRRSTLHGISIYLLCSYHSVSWKMLNAEMTVLHDPLLWGWLTDNGLLHRGPMVTLSPSVSGALLRCPETLLQQWGYGPY